MFRHEPRKHHTRSTQTSVSTLLPWDDGPRADDARSGRDERNEHSQRRDPPLAATVTRSHRINTSNAAAAAGTATHRCNVDCSDPAGGSVASTSLGVDTAVSVMPAGYVPLSGSPCENDTPPCIPTSANPSSSSNRKRTALLPGTTPTPTSLATGRSRTRRLRRAPARMTPMLITEELFLLLRRDDGKPESAFAQNGYGLAGAVISDLIVAEQITVSDDKKPRLIVLPAAHADHPVLAAALQRLRERDGKKLAALIPDRKLNLEQESARSLAEQHVIRIEENRALGFVPEQYPVLDDGPESARRQQLQAVLAGATPQVEDGVLLSILQGLDLATRVLAAEKGTLGKRDLKRRIDEVSEDAVAGHAVAQAVRSMNAAMMAVFMPAVAAGGQ